MIPEQQVLEDEAGRATCKKEASMKGEWANVGLLMFLYLLQGIPLGLGGAIPMILQSKGVSYNDQALYSITIWPFSLKLLWAPIVDAVYWNKFGRRKSWLVPTQYLIGLFMLGLSSRADAWIDDPAGPRVLTLTVFFFLLKLLAATQDVIVDGWALTMLRRENVGYASTCNCVGNTAGYFLSFYVFIALESAEFCNSYLRSEPLPYGVLTLSSFLNYFGWVFLATTTLVWILKQERPPPTDEEPVLGVLETYKQLLRIMRLPALKTFAVFLLTMSVSFSASDSISWLRLIREGLPREKFAMVTTVLIPVKLSLLLLFSKRLTGEAPMDTFMKLYQFKLALNLALAAFLWATPHMIRQGIPTYFYVLLIAVYGCLQVAGYCMFAAKSAFFARSSDPAVGGTYMTLMNTLNIVGFSWPTPLMLLLVDPLTFKRCSTDNANTCSPQTSVDCVGGCETLVDGYYVLVALCTGFGFLWLRWAIPTIRNLQRRDPQVWKVKSRCQKNLEQSQFL